MEHQTFDHDFFADVQAAAQNRTQAVVGQIGLWLLHLIKVGLLFYTSYHGIHAALLYADSALGAVAQIVGLITIELTILGLYIAYLSKALTGTAQKVAALIVYVVCLLIAAAAVVIDSQISMTTNLETLSGASVIYLTYILPIAPLAAGVGGAVVHALDAENRAEQDQIARHRAHERRLRDMQYVAHIREQEVELDVAKTVKNMQLASRLHVAKTLHDMVQRPIVLQQFREQAEQDLPTLLHAAGIDIGRFAKTSATALPSELPAHPMRVDKSVSSADITIDSTEPDAAEVAAERFPDADSATDEDSH